MAFELLSVLLSRRLLDLLALLCFLLFLLLWELGDREDESERELPDFFSGTGEGCLSRVWDLDFLFLSSSGSAVSEATPATASSAAVKGGPEGGSIDAPASPAGKGVSGGGGTGEPKLVKRLFTTAVTSSERPGNSGSSRRNAAAEASESNTASENNWTGTG